MSVMNLPLPPTSVGRRQHGAALITGLIFIVVLSMIGITAARMSTLEERMSGNLRDRSLAMQAAERALRDAERDIRGLGTRSPNISGLGNFAVQCNGDTTLATDDDGLCYRPGNVPTLSTTTISWPAFTYGGVNHIAFSIDMSAANTPSVTYGQFTGATAITGVSTQPRYIIEGVERYCWGACSGSKSAGYRITVRAVGMNPNTVVWLQEVFRP